MSTATYRKGSYNVKVADMLKVVRQNKREMRETISIYYGHIP
jgi:hypothetical protein